MNALLFERPIWFATGPLEIEEEAQEMEETTYHRPVLVTEAIELLAPRAGALIVDATCGGGGHTEEILRTGADVLAFDQDPDAIEHASARLMRYGNRVTLRQLNFRNAGEVLDQLGAVASVPSINCSGKYRHTRSPQPVPRVVPSRASTAQASTVTSGSRSSSPSASPGPEHQLLRQVPSHQYARPTYHQSRASTAQASAVTPK